MPTDWSNAPKDPDAIRDYAIDWTGDIGTATITSQSWEVVDGTVVVEQYDVDATEKIAIVRLSGGVAGETARVKNHIVLSTGEEDEYTGELTIEER